MVESVSDTTSSCRHNLSTQAVRKIITRVGQVGMCLIVTTVSIALSVMITLLTLSLMHAGEEAYRVALIISIIAPACVAPTVTWYLIGLLVKINELEEVQRRLATYDELTGVMTRRAFFERFEAVKQLAERKRTPFTLAYIDIDDFKPINDSHGHAAGDRVLIAFADHLKACVRSSDLVGRLGGEEFAIVLPETDIRGAYIILERIMAEIKKHPLEINGHTISYSISIGVTLCSEGKHIVIDHLVQQADTALYQAKAEGKDCIVQYA